MFQPTNVLVPTDFSGNADRALQEALDIAGAYRSRIFLLHVIGDMFRQYAADYCIDQRTTERILNESIIFSNQKLQETIGRFPNTWEAKVIPDVRKGRPHEEILKVAAERGVDLIVIGSHGKTGLKSLPIGSVAEKVVKEAMCPVLLIRS